MLLRLLADAIVVVHLLFIAFAMAGGWLALRWRWLLWLHLPALAWGLTVEFTGWMCPLTPMENRLREASGGAGYGGSFIDHYLLPVIYPDSLTRDAQLLIGVGLLAINAIAYLLVFRQAAKR